MDGTDLVTRLAHTIDAHDWDGLPRLLHDEFTCRLVHTGEVFDKAQWVRLNADYPGFERFLLEDVVGSGDRAACRGRVLGTGPAGDDAVFAVAGFLTAQDGLIRELVEVWTDVGQPPPDGTRPP